MTLSLPTRILHAGLGTRVIPYVAGTNYHWNYRSLSEHLDLIVEAVNILLPRLEDTPDVVCALGNSGILLGTTLGLRLTVPIVWFSLKNDLEVSAAHVRGRQALIVDSICITGDTLSNGYDELQNLGAKAVSAAVLLYVRDIVETAQPITELPFPLHAVCTVSDHLSDLASWIEPDPGITIAQIARQELFWRS